MSDDKKLNCDVHKLPHPIRAFHKKIGLWILGGGTKASAIDGYKRCPLRYFEYYSVSHMHDGCGRFFMPNKGETKISPGDCVIISPGTLHRYGGCEGMPYIEDAVRFIGPIADALLETGIIQNGVSHLGNTREVLPIWEDSRNPAYVSQLSANIALQKLLFEIYKAKKLLSNNVSPIEKLILELRNNIGKWWTVKELADLSNMSIFRIRNLFVEYTGTTPKNYIEKLKMQRAIEMLSSEKTSINVIADSLGYMDPYHFSRRFKHIIGISPDSYRKNVIRIDLKRNKNST